MSNALKLASAVGGAAAPLYVDDVFSTYLYTGNGSTQTITNGIDLAGKGGMVWIKNRNSTQNHYLINSSDSTGYALSSNGTGGGGSLSGSSWLFTNTGFSFNGPGFPSIGTNGNLYTSWTFRKAPKFFDVVTYTGDGGGSKTINHSLGIEPGMVIIKRTDTTGDWCVGFPSITPNGGYLNLTNAFASNSISGATSTNVSLGNTGTYLTNVLNASYVAYLFAHDPSADGIIQCGSFTTDGSGNATVNLGWEPQYLMVKSSSSTGGWAVTDAMRGLSQTLDSTLAPHTSNAEANWGAAATKPSATGFSVSGSYIGASTTYIYLAIRRSNKPPTSGTQVFQPVTYTGNGTANRLVNTGLLTDLFLAKFRNQSGSGFEGMVVGSRLTGDAWMKTALTQGELTTNGLQTPTASYGNSFSAMNGFGVVAQISADATYANLNINAGACIAHAFKRAKGFMDVVCYTGGTTVIPHGLGVEPELIIFKTRNSGTPDWSVYCKYITSPTNNYLKLNNSGSSFARSNWCYSVNSSNISVDTSLYINAPGYQNIAILFATLPGISKVGTVSVGLSDVNVDCGFTTGARYVLLKRPDGPSDWYVFDTARGIVVGNDPVLFLNTSGAEISSSDLLAPYSAGFTIKYAILGNANWIYLAIA